MIIVIVAAWLMMLLLFVLGLCRASGDADSQMALLQRELVPRQRGTRDR